jgi:hypothetical protein
MNNNPRSGQIKKGAEVMVSHSPSGPNETVSPRNYCYRPHVNGPVFALVRPAGIDYITLGKITLCSEM